MCVEAHVAGVFFQTMRDGRLTHELLALFRDSKIPVVLLGGEASARRSLSRFAETKSGKRGTVPKQFVPKRFKLRASAPPREIKTRPRRHARSVLSNDLKILGTVSEKFIAPVLAHVRQGGGNDDGGVVATQGGVGRHPVCDVNFGGE